MSIFARIKETNIEGDSYENRRYSILKDSTQCPVALFNARVPYTVPITPDMPLEVISINYPKIRVSYTDFKPKFIPSRKPLHPYQMNKKAILDLDIKDIKTCWITP